MEEWKEYNLGQLVELKNGVAFKSSEFVEQGVPVIKIKNVKPNRILLEDLSYVSQISSLNKKCFDVLPTDILITMTGNRKDGGADSWVGKVALFNHKGKFLLNQRVSAIRVKNKNLVDYVYLSYLLSGWDAQIYFVNHSNSSGGQANISPDVVNNYSVSLPPLFLQYKISSILKSLDDKIEVNRRINDNLEQQAQALFKSWFVDFEPFKDGEFVESELGMIPKGWRVVTLNDACKKITDGSHYSPKDSANGSIPMLSVKDMNHNGFDYSSCKMIDSEEFNRMKANDCVPLKEDILVAKDGSYLKEIFICHEEIQQAILSSIAIFRSNNEVVYPDILLQLLRSPNVRKDVGDNYVSGSALPRIVLKDFKKYKFIVAPIEVQNRLYETLRSINRCINCNEQKSRRLATLRDTLLPRLMSGELKVNEIDF